MYGIRTFTLINLIKNVKLTLIKQNYKSVCKKIEQLQQQHFKLRERQRRDHEIAKAKLDENAPIDAEAFWKEKTEHTPEARLQTHMQQLKLNKQEEEAKKKATTPEYEEMLVKKERQFFSDDGRPYSFNDPKVDYEYDADGDESVVLTVHVYKHMDTSLLAVDIQPNYVRVTLKGKALQLALNEEVKPDWSSAKRSQITGYLVITMPKVNAVVRAPREEKETKRQKEETKKKEQSNFLEFDDSFAKNRIDISKIVSENERAYNEMKAQKLAPRSVVRLRENSPGFVDDLDVPPLS